MIGKTWILANKRTNLQKRPIVNGRSISIFSNAKGAYITKLVNQHNHTITNDDKFFHSNKLIDTKLIKEIKMFAKEKLTATQIKNILMQKYQEIHLIDKKLDNIIQSTKKISKDDAADLYKKLNEYKNKNPLWFVEASVDVYTRRLNKLFWINPTQKIN